MPRLLAAAAVTVLAAAGGAAVDVTERVRARPDLVRALEQACAWVCQGNRAEARLRRVTATPQGGERWLIEAEVALRNHHVQPVPAGLGGLLGRTVTLFDHTIVVRGRGTLDRPSCRLTLEAVEVERDVLGLARLLAGEIVRGHTVDRCAELLPSAPSPPRAAPRGRP